MSDPMTNTEVEDVLASIRRLVSDDNRPGPEDNTPAPSDRLVLTPALRVMDDATADEEETQPDEEAAAAPTDHDEHTDRASFEEDLNTHAGEDDPVDDLDVSADENEAEVAVSENDSEASPVQEEPLDAAEAEPITLDTVDLDQDTLMSIQDAFDDVERAETVEAEAQAGAESREEPDANTLSAKIAALETLIAGQTEEYEPETAGDGDNAGTEPPTLEWEDAVEDDAAAQDWAAAEPETPIEAAPEEAQVFSSDEDVLDEEALRDLVSDIVREELQGALGERITRNVRKLVRREIHRALAAQDLE